MQTGNRITDYDYGGKFLIKSKLKNIGKNGLASNDNSTSSKNDIYKSFNTPFGEKKDLIISNSNISDNSENKNDKAHKKSRNKNIKKKKHIFKGEDENTDDKGKKNNIKKRNMKNNQYKNKKGENEIKESVSIILDKNKDFYIFYEKALGSSIATFLETSKEKAVIEENNFFGNILKKENYF